MKRKQRSSNQIKEDKSREILKTKLPEEWVIHEYGPDYGIDFVVEIFDYTTEQKEIAETLGELFFVQLKGSDNIKYMQKKIYPRQNVAKNQLRKDVDTCIDISVAKYQLDASLLSTVYSMGAAIPVLLFLVDLESKRVYFLCLNDYIEKVIIPEDPKFLSKTQTTKTIYIPIQNEILLTPDGLLPLRAYGKRAKMYSAFNTFHYQFSEMNQLIETNNKNQFLEMISVFAKNSLSQEIWSKHKFWEPMNDCHGDLQKLKCCLEEGITDDNFELFQHICWITWSRLANLGDMYEEIQSKVTPIVKTTNWEK